jgi:ElaB/YqjD/DUF883 family membrane-anchored ribosome-binding protein
MEQQPRRLTGAGAPPQNVDEARRVVEASRLRISATLEALEDRLVEKKQALHRRLDVARPMRGFVRSRPLVGLAVAAGAGLLLGVLGGGADEGDEEDLGEAEVAAIRRWRRERRKRLLSVAEDELPSFEPPPSRVGRLFRDMTHELAGAATALVIAALVERVRTAESEDESTAEDY